MSVADVVTTAAPTLTTLVRFTGADGYGADGGLMADAAGNLFGTTAVGGASGHGTVYEIVRTPTGYAGAPTTLFSFNGADGDQPLNSLIADAAGDLFGTTSLGGANGDGTVFELVNGGGGNYGLITLVTFNKTNGEEPRAGLITDAAGGLFGTTSFGGVYGDGTVFEIVKTGDGYADKPTTLASFDAPTGLAPVEISSSTQSATSSA